LKTYGILYKKFLDVTAIRSRLSRQAGGDVEVRRNFMRETLIHFDKSYKTKKIGKLIMAFISILLIAGIAAGCGSAEYRGGGKTGVPADGMTDTVVRQDDGGTGTPEQPGGNGDASHKGPGDTGADEIPPLTDEEIAGTYQKAVEAFGWFEFGTMPADYEDVKEEDGYQYYRVTHDTIKTYDGLRSYLQTIFDDSIVDRLLAGDSSGIRLYRDFDGALYTIPAGRGSDITKGEETYEIIREGDKKVIYRVTVEVYDDPVDGTVAGTEQYDFPLEYIGGRWVFTSFQLVR